MNGLITRACSRCGRDFATKSNKLRCRRCRPGRSGLSFRRGDCNAAKQAMSPFLIGATFEDTPQAQVARGAFLEWAILGYPRTAVVPWRPCRNPECGRALPPVVTRTSDHVTVPGGYAPKAWAAPSYCSRACRARAHFLRNGERQRISAVMRRHGVGREQATVMTFMRNEREGAHPCVRKDHPACRTPRFVRAWAYANLPFDTCYVGLEPLAAEDRTLDHVVPLDPRPGEEQGTHCIDNVGWACQGHNSMKGNRPLDFVFEAEPTDSLTPHWPFARITSPDFDERVAT